jgi:hypothetical protein
MKLSEGEVMVGVILNGNQKKLKMQIIMSTYSKKYLPFRK